MGAVRLRILEDFLRWSAEVRVTCPKCAHTGLFSVHDILQWFRTNRWNTALELAPHRFRCSQCNHKPCKLSAVMPDPKLPDPKPRPKRLTTAPYGLDSDQWAKANDAERKRMLERLRG